MILKRSNEIYKKNVGSDGKIVFIFIHLRFHMVFIQISYFECYEYSRIFRENVALFTLKKKSSESNLYLWKSEKKIVVTSTRVILRKTDFFRFSPRNS